MAGVAYNFGWISDTHAQYLGMGGIDSFVGDGRIRSASERVLDVFYSLKYRKSFWLS